VLCHLPARNDRFEKPDVAIRDERDDERIALDINDHHLLARIGLRPGVVEHVEKATGSDVEDDVFKRNAPFFLERGTLGIVPMINGPNPDRGCRLSIGVTSPERPS